MSFVNVHVVYSYCGINTPLKARVDLGAMTMKGYYIFPKTLGLEPHHQIVYCHIKTLLEWGSYSSAEMHSVYSSAPGNRDITFYNIHK